MNTSNPKPEIEKQTPIKHRATAAAAKLAMVRDALALILGASQANAHYALTEAIAVLHDVADGKKK